MARPQGYCTVTDDCGFRNGHEGLCSTPKRIAAELANRLAKKAEAELLAAVDETIWRLGNANMGITAAKLGKAVRCYRAAKGQA